MRVVILGNYPIYPFIDRLGIQKKAIKRITSWNFTFVNELRKIANTEIYVITSGKGVLNKTTIIEENNLHIFYLVESKLMTGLTMFNNFVRQSHKLIETIKPDIVHGIGTEHIWPYAAVSSGYPCIVTVHGIMSEIVKKVKTPLFSRMRYFAHLEKKTLRYTKNLIVISPYVEQMLAQYTKAEMYPIENPISDIYYDVLAKPNNNKTILFVGDTLERKSLGTLLEAFSTLVANSNASDWNINVVGPIKRGDYYNNVIVPTMIKNNISQRINFKGFMFPEQLAEEYSKSACLVLTSIEETAPMCIAEAMAVGLPVIASRISGIPYMVKEGESGFLFEPKNVVELAEKMKILIENPSLRVKMGSAGRRSAAERWKPQMIVQKTSDIYSKIIGENPCGKI